MHLSEMAGAFIFGKGGTMSKIKTRETHKDIKALDKAAIAGERMRDAFIRTKDHAQNLTDDGQVSPSEYAAE